MRVEDGWMDIGEWGCMGSVHIRAIELSFDVGREANAEARTGRVRTCTEELTYRAGLVLISSSHGVRSLSTRKSKPRRSNNPLRAASLGHLLHD